MSASDGGGPQLEAIDSNVSTGLTHGTPTMGNAMSDDVAVAPSAESQLEVRRQLQEMTQVLKAELHRDILNPLDTDATPKSTPSHALRLSQQPQASAGTAPGQQELLLQEERNRLSAEKARREKEAEERRQQEELQARKAEEKLREEEQKAADIAEEKM